MSSPPIQMPNSGTDVETATVASSSTSSSSSCRPQLEAIQTHRAQACFQPTTKVTTASFVSNTPPSQQQHRQQQWEHEHQQQLQEEQPLATILPYYHPNQEQQPSSGQDIPHSSSLSSSPPVPASSSSSFFPDPTQSHHSATASITDCTSPSTTSPHSATPGTETFPFTPSTVVAAHSPTAARAAMASYIGDSTDASSFQPPLHKQRNDDNDDDLSHDTFDNIPLSSTQMHPQYPLATTSHDSLNEIPNPNVPPAIAATLPATGICPPASPFPSSLSPSPIALTSSVPAPPLSSSRASPGPSPSSSSSGGVNVAHQSHPSSSSSIQGRSQSFNSPAALSDREQRRGSAGTGNRSSHHDGSGGGVGYGKGGGSHSNAPLTPGGANGSKEEGGRNTNLPTLWQVLHRKTLPPVCLFNFYLYMRDYERSSEQVDFWLDVTTHEVLWRLYVRTLRRKEARERAEERQLAREREEREQRAAAAAAAADRWQKDQEEASKEPAPRSMSLELIKPHWTVAKRFLDMSHEERQEYGEQTGLRWEDVKDVMLERAKLEEAQLDQELLRQEREGSSAETQDQQMASLDVQQSLQVQPHLRDMTNIDGKLGAKHSLEPILLSDASLGYQPRQSPSTPVSQDNLPVQDESSQQRQRKKVQTPIAGPSSAPAPSLAPRPNSTFRRQSSTGNGVSDGASAGASDTPRRGNAKGLSGMAVTREEVLRSAERIYLKYLTPQAEKHIYIPPSIRQRIAALMDGYLMNTHHQQQAYSEQRTTDADIASNGGNRNEDVASKDEARSTLTPSPASVERKEFSKSRSGVNWDSNHEKQGSYPGAAESTRARSFHSGPAAKGGMRASSTSQSIGRPNSPKGSFALPQPDQDLGLVFAEAREFVFTTMERYYFPRFLRARVYGNMVHLQRIFRLFLGLFFLFLGFTTVLCLIFLNAQPRSKRAWALIPMFTGVMLCTTFQFNLCPILAALNLSENKLMNFAKNKEPYIIRLHRLRALKVVAVAILYTTCLGIIFGFVPGYRL